MALIARGDDPTVREVDDALWAELRPLLAVDEPRKQPGAPRKGERGLFNGLIWLARTGGQWAAIPRRYGAKSTIHDRFQGRVAYGCFRVGPLAIARDEGTGASAFATRGLAIAALIVANTFGTRLWQAWPELLHTVADAGEQAHRLPARLIPQRHRPRAELQSAHEPQVEMRREPRE